MRIIRPIIIASAVASVMSFAGSAFAADCVIGAEHKIAVLDWQRDSNDVPQIDQPLRVFSDVCVSSEGKLGVQDRYTMRGLPADKFWGPSRPWIEDMVKKGLPAQKFRAEVGVEKFNVLMDFLDTAVAVSKITKPLAAADPNKK